MSPSGDIGVLTTDVSLLVESWDDWLARVTAISADEARGRPLPELVPALEERGLLNRFRQTLASGSVQVLSSTLHGPMIPCATRSASRHFDEMQQRVTIGPLLDRERIAGLVITIQDVTAQLDAERDLAAALMSDDVDERRAAAEAITDAPRIESLDSFAPVLGSADWRVRRAAVTAIAAAADAELLRAVLTTLQREHRDFSTLSSALRLLTVTDQDITEPLTELLREADADLRIQAALALGEQSHPAAVAPLLAALQDPDVNVRFHAIESLGRLRAPIAVEPLLAIAESGDFFLGFAALESLAAIGDARVAPRIVRLVENEGFRDAAVRALSRLGNERAVAPLVAVLNDAPDAALAVLQALAAIGGRLAHEGLDVSPLVRAALDADGRRHLLAAVRDAGDDAAAAIARVLRWIGVDEATQALGALLANPAVREEAAAALVDNGEASVDVLVEHLDHPDEATRAVAIGALGQIGSRRATRQLVRLLDHPHTSIAACGALARIADREAFEPLLAMIGHRDPAIRMAAVGALNTIGHPQMQDRIVPLLDDENPLVRESAVRIAGYFGYPAAAEVMRARAADPDEGVRIAALEHLPLFDDALALQVLASVMAEGTPKTRAAVIRALTRVESAAALPMLASALEDQDAWVRYFAARAIGERPERTVVPGLVAMAESDPSTPARVAAIEAIGKRRVAISIAPVVRAAESDNIDVASVALVALGRLDGPDAMARLHVAARSAEPARRKAAAEGLAACGSREAVAELEWMSAADADREVFECAIQKLTEIASAGREESPRAIEAILALLAEADRSDAAIEAIARLPLGAVPGLAAGLRHAQPVVRRRTVEALARYRHSDATRLLAPAFDDPDPTVRETAAAAVLRLGTRLFDDLLGRLAGQDPSNRVRRTAAAALARVTD